jgi:hypothetical protein
MDRKGILITGTAAIVVIALITLLLMPYILPPSQTMSEKMVIVASDMPGEGWQSLVVTSGSWHDGTVRAYKGYNLTDMAHSQMFPATSNDRTVYTFLFNFNSSADAEAAYLNSYNNFIDAEMSPYFNASDLSGIGDRSFASNYTYLIGNFNHTVTVWVLEDNFYFFQMFFWVDDHGFTDAEMLQIAKIQAEKVKND